MGRQEGRYERTCNAAAIDYKKVGILFADIRNNEISQYATFPYLTHSPDLSNFTKQESSLDTVDEEFCRQTGCGDYGFSGTMAFHINDNYYLMYDYSE